MTLYFRYMICVRLQHFFMAFALVFFLTISGTAYSQSYVLSDTTKAIALMKQAFDGVHIDPAKSLQLSDEVFKISKALNYKKGIANSLLTRGMAYAVLKDNKAALECFNKALGMARNNWPRSEAAILVQMGNLYYRIGIFDKATEAHLNAMKVDESVKDVAGMALCNDLIGADMSSLKSYEEAIRYEKCAVDLYNTINDQRGVANVFNNIASNYISLENYALAFQYLKECVKICKTLNDSLGLSYPYLNLGVYYAKKGKNDSALYYNFEAIRLFEKIHEKSGQVDATKNVGSIYESMHDFKKAEQYYISALALAEKISDRFYKYKTESALAGLYEKSHDYPKAYKFLNLSLNDKDSLFNDEKLKTIEELTIRFAVKEAGERNSSLQKENDIQKLRLQRKDILVYGTSGLALLLFIIGTLTIRQGKIKADQQRIELEQKQLRAQMNPHFIFNCLNSIQHFIVHNDVENANRYLSDFAYLMRQTLENSKDGTITLGREINYLENYLSLERMRFENKFTAEIICAENLDKDAIEIPAMIIQPFVENAIRHGLCYLENREGRLVLYFHLQDEQLVCEVDDNGIGREQSQKLKLGSGIAHESHGMELTRQRLALVSKNFGSDYQLQVVDKKDSEGIPDGTKVIIKFPLHS